MSDAAWERLKLGTAGLSPAQQRVLDELLATAEPVKVDLSLAIPQSEGQLSIDDVLGVDRGERDLIICEYCERGDHGHCEERWCSWCDCECNPCMHPQETP